MRKLILLITLLLPAAGYSAVGEIFYDGGEGWTAGSNGPWTTKIITAGSVSTSTARSTEGRYSILAEDTSATQNNAFVRKTSLTAGGTWYGRFDVYLDSVFWSTMTTLGTGRALFYIYDNTSTNFFNFIASKPLTANPRGFETYWYPSDAGQQSNFIPNADQWYNFTFSVSSPSANSVFRWWVNGIPQTSYTADMGVYKSWGEANCGLGFSDLVMYTTQKAYYDSIVISSVPDTVAPSAPSNFTATTINTSSITLSWTAPGDDGTLYSLTGAYAIQYSSVSTTTWSTAAASTLTLSTACVKSQSTETWVITGLASGTPYYFNMWARDIALNWSSISGGATSYTNMTVIRKRYPQITGQ